MTLLERLDPRRHLSAAIGWAVFGVVTLAALLTAEVAARQAERRALVDAENLLAEFATQVRDAVSMQLQTRRSVVEAIAITLRTLDPVRSQSVNGHIADVRRRFPEFTWLAVADREGIVVHASDPASLGRSLAAQAWFRPGTRQSIVSDGREAAAVPLPLGTASPPDGHHDLHLVVPTGEGGVVAARLPMRWLAGELERMQAAFGRNRDVQLLMTARDGSVLFGPPRWIDRRLDAGLDVSEGGAFVVGSRTRLRLADNQGLGWTAVVRQGSSAALESARATRRTVFAVVFAAGLLAATLAAAATRLLMRRVTRLARDAESIRSGRAFSLAVPSGRDEIARIGGTLAAVVDHLQAEKGALQTLNAELDRRVGERTRHIERLAEESRHVAVTRERLRLARDLHDTLAHSLMALLTQVRLVRKLRSRMSAEELDAELARAEEATAAGLTEARAAIAQMRDNPVRDTGLALSLRELVERFRQRSGLDASMEQAGETATLVDIKAETAFRIAEEALRNVERHAGARSVRVRLLGTPLGEGRLRVRLEVHDDGVGFDPVEPRAGHFGLRGMAEQAELIQAHLTLATAPGRGTQVGLEFES